MLGRPGRLLGSVKVGTVIPLASIFATGGMLKSVNYLDRQFQDSTGTTAVSANDNPVGLALGYAQWGGKTLAEVIAGQPELVANGTFVSDTSGWVVLGGGSIAWHPSGGIACSDVADLDCNAQTNFTAIAGRKYNFSWDVKSSNGIWLARIRNSADFERYGGSAVGSFRAIPTVGGVAGTVNLIEASANSTTVFDNVSVKEIPGKHATQSTTNFRPVYKTAENGHWFFDGSDDSWLDTFLMGQEGMLAFDGTPTGTSDVFIGAKDTTNGNGYLGNNASGAICGAVGSDGFSTIVDSTGTDRSNTRILALLKWSATQNLVQLKVDNVLVYSGPKTGAVSTTVPIREGALNSNGTANSFFAGRAKMFYAHNRMTTDAEDTAIFNQRII